MNDHDHEAEDQALKPAAARLLASARRREREEDKRLRLQAELDAMLKAPLIAPRARVRR